MNPEKLGKLDNQKQERWKLPLPLFIEECYFKRFAKARPDDCRSIEIKVAEKRAKKAAMRQTENPQIPPVEADPF